MLAHSTLKCFVPKIAIAIACGLCGAIARAGTWTPIAHAAPGPVDRMMLLSDGTVLATNGGSAWFRLTPDIHGSDVHGTWTTLASSNFTRLYYPSQVLRDGRVFVAGGEYGTGGPHAEVYDPLTNAWTVVDPPASLWNVSSDNFYDCNSEILPDGQVLIMPVFPHSPGAALRYNPATNTWSSGGHLAHGTFQDEASWVKLADDSILTIDPFGTLSERYIPATNTWINDGVVPVSLYDPYGSEIGAALLLANGRAFFLGATGHTALYTPTGTTSPGTWAAGPDIPGGQGTPDAPAAMMVTGNILCIVSPAPTSGDHFPAPIAFYEFDPIASAYNPVIDPTGGTLLLSSYSNVMLDLPDASVLYSPFSTQLYAYQPSGAPLAAGKPAITSVTQNLDGSYHLVGTGLNGISEGAAYGDDVQMNSNYPIVRLSDGAGNVYYARTFAWSGTSVQTGSASVSTEFRLPDGLQPATYALVVVANGNASDPVPLLLPGISSPTCAGDGSFEICPCFNFGAANHGCASSSNAAGALLSASGASSLAADSVQLTTSGEVSSALSIVLQGDTIVYQVPFGDGLRCAGGHLERLFTKTASSGSIMAPSAGDPTISARSAALGDPYALGAMRIYQVYYRDPNIAFCGNGFNATNGVFVVWGN
jgi:hypothetical protein